MNKERKDVEEQGIDEKERKVRGRRIKREGIGEKG